MKTKFINNSRLIIKLKEGNAGVFYKICELSKSESFEEVNHIATYREYKADTGSKGETLILSEDVYKHSTIRIVDSDSKWKKSRFEMENSRVEGGIHAPWEWLIAPIKWWRSRFW